MGPETELLQLPVGEHSRQTTNSTPVTHCNGIQESYQRTFPFHAGNLWMEFHIYFILNNFLSFLRHSRSHVTARTRHKDPSGIGLCWLYKTSVKPRIGSKRILFITARLNDARREPTRGRWMSLLPHTNSAAPGRTAGGSCKENAVIEVRRKAAEQGEESCLAFQSSIQKEKWDCKKQGGRFALGSLLPESSVSSVLHFCCARRWEHTMLHPDPRHMDSNKTNHHE